MAVFDTRAMRGAVTVRFADGSERFTPLGQSDVERPEPGEVIFSDDVGVVLARRWCWRQSAQSAAQADTTSAIITVEAHHDRARADIEAALKDLTELLTTYAGGELATGLLSAENPALAAFS